MQDRRANVVITDPPYNRAGTHLTEPSSIRPTELKMVADEMNESEFADFLAQAFAFARVSQCQWFSSLHFHGVELHERDPGCRKTRLHGANGSLRLG